MPRHRSLNLKKFADSIAEPLIEEYLKQKLGGRMSLSFKTFDYDPVNKLLDTIWDENLKSSILEDFTHINEICEKMMNIMVKAVQRYGIETADEEERQALAMDIFLNHKEAFDYVYDYYCLFNASSKMSHCKITEDNFEINPEKMDRFKAPYQKDKVNYISAFTEAILGDESQAERPDRDVTYTLEPLQKGTFSFAGNEVITSITL